MKIAGLSSESTEQTSLNLIYVLLALGLCTSQLKPRLPDLRDLPGNMAFLQCYIWTFPPAPRVKLDCYTLMAPVYTLKILLNRFHGNYSFRIAQKIVPSVAKTLACSAE